MTAARRALIGSILGASVLFSGFAFAQAADPIELFVATDIHYLAESLRDDGAAFKKIVYEGDGKNIELISEILDSFASALRKERPAALIVSGDLTVNGERASHSELASRFAAIEARGVKVYVIPGNHDIENPWARGFKNEKQYKTESVTAAQFQSIYRSFGYGEAISRDADSLSYVAEPARGLRLLMLDTAEYRNNSFYGFPQARGGLGAGTLDWIRGCLSEARATGARMIVAMHHNLVDHNDMIRDGYTIDDADSIRELFAEFGIDFALTGHVHIQDIGEAKTSRGTFFDIATNALSVYPHQFGVLRVSPRERSVDYRTRRVDVEGWARETASADARLIGFSEYAEKFFWNASAFMVRRALAKSGTLVSADQMNIAVSVMGTLNSRFFAGREALNAADSLLSAAYRQFAAMSSGFLPDYARSILGDPSPEDNALRLVY